MPGAVTSSDEALIATHSDRQELQPTGAGPAQDKLMQNKIEELKSRLAEIQALEAAASVLAWDQTTFMPSGSADSRGRHLAVLAQLSQEKFIAPEMGHLLDDLAPYIETLPADSDEARLIQVTRRDYEHALRIPPAWLG